MYRFIIYNTKNKNKINNQKCTSIYFKKYLSFTNVYPIIRMLSFTRLLISYYNLIQ